MGGACPPIVENVENYSLLFTGSVGKEGVQTNLKKKSTIRQCEIVSNLYDKEEKILFDMGELDSILAQKTCILQYSYIVHDKDTYTKEDEKRNPEHKAGTLKPPHIHLLLKFNSPQHFENIGKWFGLSENFVSKLLGGWNSAVVYQIHRNAKEKYQYSIDEVTANFDVQAIIDNYSKKAYLEKILNGILDGTIREYNKTKEIDNLALVYHSREIKEAFKIYQERLQATQKDRSMECIYITGQPRAGKTTLAKQIAKAKCQDYFISSGSNDILDGYGQEPCIILDEMRPSSLGLADLLKLLDNNTASSVKSRYKNKAIYCDLIIITSILDIDTFYKNVFTGIDEPITQLKRRCGTYIHMYEDHILISSWDDKAMCYSPPVEYKNTVLKKYIPEKNLTPEDVKKKVETLIPFLELAETPPQDGWEAVAESETPFASLEETSDEKE